MGIGPSGGGGAEVLGTGSGEGRVAAEAAAVAGFRGPHAAVDVFPGQHQPLLGDVQMDGGACFLAEQAHHVVFADEEGLGQVTDVDILAEIGIDVADDLPDPLVPWHHGTGPEGLAASHGSADFHQKAQKSSTAQDLPAEFLLPQIPLQRCRHLEYPALLAVLQTQHVSLLAGEDGEKTALGGGELLQIVRRNIDDDPLIGDSGVQLRPVDAAAAQQHDIPCLQQVAMTVNVISAAAGQKQQDLAEFMIVVIHLGALGRAQVKQTEIFQQIAPLFVVCHGNPLQHYLQEL